MDSTVSQCGYNNKQNDTASACQIIDVIHDDFSLHYKLMDRCSVETHFIEMKS